MRVRVRERRLNFDVSAKSHSEQLFSDDDGATRTVANDRCDAARAGAATSSGLAGLHAYPLRVFPSTAATTEATDE
jgi:hypothetical protein